VEKKGGMLRFHFIWGQTELLSVTAMFACPNCSNRLARVQNELGIYWGCQTCGGRTVSISVLRKAIDRDFVNQLWQKARSHSVPGVRRCPACNHRMVEVEVADADAEEQLDVCRTCQFVWFDPNEFETAPHVPPMPSAPKEKPLPQEAREALALYQVQRMAEEARAEPAPPESWQLIPALFGLPVESETDSLKRLPWFTWGTAALIAFASMLAFQNLEAIVGNYGLMPGHAWRHGGITFITSFFLHGGWLHLLGNLYFLLIFGDNVEDYLGRWRCFLLLVLASVVGDFAHILGEPHSVVPAIGASGGISGIIAFYALKFPHARLGFLWRLYWYFRWIQLPAWGAFCLWIALQLLGALEQISGFTNVSALAHLGGAAVGVALWAMWRKK